MLARKLEVYGLSFFHTSGILSLLEFDELPHCLSVVLLHLEKHRLLLALLALLSAVLGFSMIPALQCATIRL